MLFYGEHQHTLDAKSRVILPARFREPLIDGLFLAPGLDRCVDVFPAADFERRVEELRALPREDAGNRAFARVFQSRVHRDAPDGQGRITVPEPLREYAGLSKDLTVVGADDRVEIWDRATWASYFAAAEPEYAARATPFNVSNTRLEGPR